MLNIGKDIHSLTDFKRRTSELVEQLHQTKRPIVLTVNGRPEVVIQQAGAYQQLLYRLNSKLGRRDQNVVPPLVEVPREQRASLPS